jgi:hypothetical protein
MAKQLKDILKAASDTIKGVRPSTTTDLSLGKDPGVDYDPKAKDEQDFVAKHSVQKWDDPNGNGSDVFQATNIKHSQVDEPHGYKKPKDKKVNEESFDEAWIVTHKDGKVTTHAGQRDALKASKSSPGSKVSATHGAMGQRAHAVLEPHQRGDMGTFSAAGYTPPKKKKKMKEEAELDEGSYSGTPSQTKLVFSGSPSHTSKKAADYKKRGYEVHSIKKHTSGSFGDNAEKHTYTMLHKSVKEEVEQVDEVLTKKEPASTWIRDFVHSKNPKFAGKSKKERQRMALGAYYAKQRNEEVEELDERDMVNKAKKDAAIQKIGSQHKDEKHLGDRMRTSVANKIRGREVTQGKNRVQENLAIPLLGGMDDDESAEMAKAQLKALAAKANALADQLSDDLMIEPWVQSKIAVAKDYVTSVHDYMIYGEHDKNNEQTGPDTPMTFPNMSVDVNTGHNV